MYESSTLNNTKFWHLFWKSIWVTKLFYQNLILTFSLSKLQVRSKDEWNVYCRDKRVGSWIWTMSNEDKSLSHRKQNDHKLFWFHDSSWNENVGKKKAEGNKFYKTDSNWSSRGRLLYKGIVSEHCLTA